MADVETLAERVQTVERAVTDGTGEFPDATTLADVESRIETLETTVEEIDDRTAELEAATQALRGYVGNIRSVNEDVEQRADAAIAATERLEQELRGEQAGTREASQSQDTFGARQPPVQSATRPKESRPERSSSDRSARPGTDRNASGGSGQRANEFDTLADSIETGDPAESQTDTDDPGLFARIRERL